MPLPASEASSATDDVPQSRPSILTTVEYYLPGFRSGGPLRSLASVIDALGGRFRFSVLTRDHDLGESSPFPNVARDAWNPVGQARVFYASGFGRQTLLRVVREAKPDLIYLNSCFAHINVRLLALRRMGKLPDVPILICPRGEFTEGALSLKRWKKSAYLNAAFPLRLYEGVEWHAASEAEAADIRRVAGDTAVVHLAPNVSSAVMHHAKDRPPKHPGSARIAHVGRITQVKNLMHAIRALAEVKGNIELDLYGTVDDAAYWAECRAAIGKLPPSIQVVHRGVVEHDRIPETLGRYHFFLLPTLGENFGHAIVEALACGCPAIISDRTPFRHLRERGAGWDMPLEDLAAWTATLEACVNMDAATYARQVAAAQKLASEIVGPAAAEPALRMFEKVLRGCVAKAGGRP